MLQVGKPDGVVVHGSGVVTRRLQQGVVVHDKEQGGGDGKGKQPAGRIGTRHGEPGVIAVPLPRLAPGDGVDGEGLPNGLPRIKEEQLPLGGLLVPPLLG